MKGLTLSSDDIDLLDVFCNKLSLAEPDKSFSSEVENSDIVPIKITIKELDRINILVIDILDGFFADSGVRTFNRPSLELEPETDIRYYTWLSVRPHWFAEWYRKYQKIRFYKFILMRSDELTAIAATVQIIRENTKSDGFAQIPRDYLPKSDEKLISESSNSIQDFYAKVQAVYRMMMEFGAIQSLSKSSDGYITIKFNSLLVRRIELGVEDVFKGGVLGNYSGTV